MHCSEGLSTPTDKDNGGTLPLYLNGGYPFTQLDGFGISQWTGWPNHLDGFSENEKRTAAEIEGTKIVQFDTARRYTPSEYPVYCEFSLQVCNSALKEVNQPGRTSGELGDGYWLGTTQTRF